MTSENAFGGQATSAQSNNMTGTIAVSVYHLLANGNLAVRGEKWITLNHGKEYIRFRGIVRARDITLDYTVDSTKVADARITYSGTGQGSDANSMGLVSALF